MKGHNSMSLNQATVIAILQHYFDTVLFAADQSPKISGFRYDQSENMLRVQLTTPEPSEKEES